MSDQVAEMMVTETAQSAVQAALQATVQSTVQATQYTRRQRPSGEGELVSSPGLAPRRAAGRAGRDSLPGRVSSLFLLTMRLTSAK